MNVVTHQSTNNPAASLFDAYLMVDWSANSRPKTGRDSIWWCRVVRQGKRQSIHSVSNPATRESAFSQIRQALLELARAGRRTLVGFDFSYGYPRGFAQHFAGTHPEPWLNVWQGLATRIEDRSDNSNNRFQVAARVNREITGSAAPFWGCPAGQAGEYLGTTKPVSSLAAGLDEFRLAERRVRAQSTWKLFYNGSVGGQALLGLPGLYRLRADEELGPVSCVWPFDTGLRPLDAGMLVDRLVVHAEIYPSLIDVVPGAGEVRDRLQVQQLGLHFANLDKEGRLGELFGGDPGLSSEDREVVEREEGWILGVTQAINRKSSNRQNPALTRLSINPDRSGLPTAASRQNRA